MLPRLKAITDVNIYKTRRSHMQKGKEEDCCRTHSLCECRSLLRGRVFSYFKAWVCVVLDQSTFLFFFWLKFCLWKEIKLENYIFTMSLFLIIALVWVHTWVYSACLLEQEQQWLSVVEVKKYTFSLLCCPLQANYGASTVSKTQRLKILSCICERCTNISRILASLYNPNN